MILVKIIECIHINKWLKIKLFIHLYLQTSLEDLIGLDVPFIKVGSGDANNLPLIKKAANTGKPLVLSTGKIICYSDFITSSKWSRFRFKINFLEVFNKAVDKVLQL